MSTKTTFKRVALVAAVAAAFGGLSTVAANAQPAADSLSAATTTVAATSGVLSQVAVSQTFLAQASGDKATVTAALISAPASNVALPTFETTTVTGATNYNLGSSNSGEAVSGSTITLTAVANAPTYTAGNFYLDFTPVLSGTYVVKLIPGIANGSTAGTANAASITITYTVAAKPVVNAASSTAYEGASTTAITQASNDVVVSASDAVTGSAVANIQTIQSNGSSTAALANSDATALTATVSGPGLISFDQSAAHAGRAITNSSSFNGTGGSTQANLTQNLYVFADGTAGTSTITISAGSTVLATKTVTFYGAAAKITNITVVNSILPAANASAATSGAIANAGQGALTAVVVDANGVPVANATLYAVSQNTSVISNSYTSATTNSSGVATWNLNGVAAGTTTILVTNVTSATDTTTTPLAGVAQSASIRVGSTTAATVKITTDQASYVPGQAATVKVQVLDANGLPVPNGVYAVFTGVTTAGLAITAGTLPGTASASVTTSSVLTSPTVAAGSVWVTDNNGDAQFSVNMPVTAGTETFSGTGASGLAASQAGLAITGSAVVTAGPAADAASAATDAANEATDAANAATDAANAAADAADAATSAAQDASAKADAALAAVNALSAKITVLAAQIAKIVKKLGA